jgi:hypothetical protein
MGKEAPKYVGFIRIFLKNNSFIDKMYLRSYKEYFRRPALV